MLLLLLLLLLFASVYGGLALSPLLWIVAVVVLLALVLSRTGVGGRW